MGVKINSIRVQGLQGYYDQTDFILSKGLTLIRGANSSGKTALSRILKAYQEDVSSKEDLRSLLNRDTDIGYSDVNVYHDDTGENYTIRHCVMRYPQNRLKNYYEIYDSDYEMVYRTEFHNDTISNYMGFEVIPEPSGCFPLNFKGAKVNAFTNTSLMTNSYILDGLCNIEDYEIRIDNIKDAIGKLNDVKKEYTKDLRYYISERNKCKYVNTKRHEKNLSRIEIKKSHIQDIYNKLEYLNLIGNEILHKHLDTEMGKAERILARIKFNEAYRTLKLNEDTEKTLKNISGILDKKLTLKEILDRTNRNYTDHFSRKTEHFIDKSRGIKMLETWKKMSNLDEKSDLFTLSSKNVNDTFSEITRCKGMIIDKKMDENLKEVQCNLKRALEVSILSKIVKSQSILAKNEEYLGYITKNLSSAVTLKEIENYRRTCRVLDKIREVNEHNREMGDNLNIRYKLKSYRDCISLSKEIEYVRSKIDVCPTCGKVNT